MKLIPLSQGQFAKVDDADYDYLMQWRWHARRETKNKNKFYAERHDKASYPVRVKMHNVINPPPEGMLVDHKDMDSLNNQRDNLRSCTYSQNSMNRKGHSVSGYKGVTKLGNRWQALIIVEGQRKFLGNRYCKHDAAELYNEGSRKYHGEFGFINEIKRDV